MSIRYSTVLWSRAGVHVAGVEIHDQAFVSILAVAGLGQFPFPLLVQYCKICVSEVTLNPIQWAQQFVLLLVCHAGDGTKARCHR